MTEIDLQQSPAKMAVEQFLSEYDYSQAVMFLRANPDEISNFCLELRDSYAQSDVTPIIHLSEIIKLLL